MNPISSDLSQLNVRAGLELFRKQQAEAYARLSAKISARQNQTPAQAVPAPNPASKPADPTGQLGTTLDVTA